MKKSTLSIFLLFYSLSISFASFTNNPPSNEECGDEIIIFSSPQAGTTDCASPAVNQTCAFVDHQVFFEYTISSSEDVDLIIDVEPDASNGNPASSLSVQVVYNCVHDLILFDEPCGSSSVIANNIESGTTVKLVIGSEAGGEGDFEIFISEVPCTCLLYTSPSPRDQRGSRMPSSA